MKTVDVPQDNRKEYEGHKRAIYAQGEDGKIKAVESTGWDDEVEITRDAIEHLEGLKIDAKMRYDSGSASPLEYHMYAARLDTQQLAAAAKMFQWQVRRHFKPAIFRKLSDQKLSAYAKILGVSSEALKEVNSNVLPAHMIHEEIPSSIPVSEFDHQHAAHCESGVVSKLMTEAGQPMTEAMVFGISGAFVFAYLPLLKLGGQPLVAYRMRPKAIINGIEKRLGIKFKKIEFGTNVAKAQAALDERIAAGKPVGVQSSVYWLPYLPESMRFQFNAHNLIIYGKNESGDYLVSDPVLESPQLCPVEDMNKARFATGFMAPKGLMYEIVQVPEKLELKKAIIDSIRTTSKIMAKNPLPLAGHKAIRKLAGDIRKQKSKDVRAARLFLGHIVRMQEEIGTGGAGFRYIYASFLQEASELLEKPVLLEASLDMLAIGDDWRKFASMVARAAKSKKGETIDYEMIATKLDSIADSEKTFYDNLLQTLK